MILLYFYLYYVYYVYAAVILILTMLFLLGGGCKFSEKKTWEVGLMGRMFEYICIMDFKLALYTPIIQNVKLLFTVT